MTEPSARMTELSNLIAKHRANHLRELLYIKNKQTKKTNQTIHTPTPSFRNPENTGYCKSHSIFSLCRLFLLKCSANKRG